ncbi:MAG: hypothetical protein KBB21_12745 [Nannocystaceae bacterium]|nr:hypothetical protein [Nannocystaceae bacterium]
MHATIRHTPQLPAAVTGVAIFRFDDFVVDERAPGPYGEIVGKTMSIGGKTNDRRIGQSSAEFSSVQFSSGQLSKD